MEIKKNTEELHLYSMTVIPGNPGHNENKYNIYEKKVMKRVLRRCQSFLMLTSFLGLWELC